MSHTLKILVWGIGTFSIVTIQYLWPAIESLLGLPIWHWLVFAAAILAAAVITARAEDAPSSRKGKA